MDFQALLARRRDPNDTLPSYNLEADPETKRLMNIFQATQPLHPMPPVLHRVYHLQPKPYYDPSLTGLPYQPNATPIRVVPVQSENSLRRQQQSLLSQMRTAKPMTKYYYDPSAPLGLHVDPWDQNLRDTLTAYIERQQAQTLSPIGDPERETLELKSSAQRWMAGFSKDTRFKKIAKMVMQSVKNQNP